MSGETDQSVSDIRGRLETLATSIDMLPTMETPPDTMLTILGEARSEAHWEALLAYFLTPDEPHGFDTDVLEAFLEVIAEQSPTPAPHRAYHLSEARVTTQIGADEGVFDLLIRVPGEWFYCIELKVHSGETTDQTIRYAESTHLGPVTVSDFPESRRNYVYLAPATKAPPKSDTFINVDWESALPAFKSVVSTGRGRYPTKSQALFTDFINTIEDELGMTEYEQYEREKVALALEYRSEIHAVKTALDEFVEHELDSWQDDFHAAATDDWQSDVGGNIYAKVYRPDWVRDASGQVVPLDAADFVLNYDVKIASNRFMENQFRMDLQRRSSYSDDKLTDEIYGAIYAEAVQSKLRRLANDHDLNLNLIEEPSGVKLLQAPLSIDVNRGETIGGQFAERVQELQPVNEIITDAISDYFR